MKTTLSHKSARVASGLACSLLLALSVHAGPGPQFPTTSRASRTPAQAAAESSPAPMAAACVTVVPGRASFANVSGKIAPTSTAAVAKHTCPVCAGAAMFHGKTAASSTANCAGCDMSAHSAHSS